LADSVPSPQSRDVILKFKGTKLKIHLNLISFFLITAITIFPFNSSCKANHIDSLILEDLNGVIVNLELRDDVAKRFKIDSAILKEAIEEKLEKANINLYREKTSEFYLTGRPEIRINVKTILLRGQILPDVVVETSFILTLRTFSNPKATKRASIASWRNYLSDVGFDDIINIIDVQMGNFVEAVCKYKKGNICNY
jgi:hypothetical protein